MRDYSLYLKDMMAAMDAIECFVGGLVKLIIDKEELA
jgi:uncharacterized protein with HEPN domain